ncbi:MAG TPA: hypothetical protein VIL29_04545 [Pseudothermotoga sp.]
MKNNDENTSLVKNDPSTERAVYAFILNLMAEQRKLIQEELQNIQRQKDQELGQLYQEIRSLKQTQKVSQEKMDANLLALQQLQTEFAEFRRGEEQRDRDQLKRDQQVRRSIRLIKSRLQLIKHITMFTDAKVTKVYQLLKQIRKYVIKIFVSVAAGTFVTDVSWDLTKEVIKESIVKEIEAVASQIRSILKPVVEPVWGPIWEVLSPIYDSIPLKIKAAIALLLIAALIINHAAKVVATRRRG